MSKTMVGRFTAHRLAWECLRAADLLEETRPCMNPASVLFPPAPQEEPRAQETARARKLGKTVEVVRGGA